MAGWVAAATAVAAPLLTEPAVTNWQELGTWDDVLVPDDLDVVLVRRGDAFSLLSVTNGFAVLPLADTPAARGSRMVGSAHCGERHWVFLQRPYDEPCAVDLANGRVVEFVTTVSRAPWGQGPGIQAHVVMPHAKAVVLMVAGGSGSLRPRPGNQPYFFWMSMATGAEIRFDPSWHLDYFDEKQLVAVFYEGRRGNNHAVDMRSGRAAAGVPDRLNSPFVPFSWTDTAPAKPLLAYRVFPPDPNPRESLIGLSSEGRTLPLGLEPVRDAYLATRRVRDGHLAFRLRAEGRSERTPGRCYVRKVEDGAKAGLVSTAATDCVLMTGGDCIYTTARSEPRGQKEEAWFRAGDGSAQWNLLEGVERLPPLPEHLAGKAHVRDSLQVTLHDAFGGARRPARVLCRFEHNQSDLYARSLPAQEEGEQLGSRHWRRTMVVSRERRVLLPVLRDNDRLDHPEFLWLHSGGRLIAGHCEWADDNDHTRRIRLRAINVE